MGTNVGTLQELQLLLAFLQQHQIRPRIERTFTLADATRALAHLEGAHGFGKVVVKI
jgi:NADPH:quinone reductase-like Zn-dependent oxidoreductase